MDVILDDAPGDRIVTELYAWVVTDLRTGLEGIFAMNFPSGMEMQFVTSSPDTAKKIGELIRKLPFKGRRFRLVKFIKAETLLEI